MHYKKSSWREKIDPALDSALRFFYDSLDSMELPHTDYLNNKIQDADKTGIRSFKAFYEGSAEVVDSGVLGAVTGDGKLGNTISSIVDSKNKGDIEGLYKSLMRAASELPDGSRAYYEKAFASLSSVENVKVLSSSLDEEKKRKWSKRLGEDISCLLARKAFKDMAAIDIQKER